MEQEQNDVKRFHREFGLLINNKPCIPPFSDIETAIQLIDEEFEELQDAIIFLPSIQDVQVDIVKVADALGDLIYVILGMAIRFGIDMQPVWNEIQRSNMSKVGGKIDERGKYIKPENYSKADLETVLIKQGWEK